MAGQFCPHSSLAEHIADPPVVREAMVDGPTARHPRTHQLWSHGRVRIPICS